MLNKFKNWWNKPWTNGTYVKWTFWGMLLCLIVTAAELARLFDWNPIKKK